MKIVLPLLILIISSFIFVESNSKVTNPLVYMKNDTINHGTTTVPGPVTNEASLFDKKGEYREISPLTFGGPLTVTFWAKLENKYTYHYFLDMSQSDFNEQEYRIAIFIDDYNKYLYTNVYNSQNRENRYRSERKFKETEFYGVWQHFIILFHQNGDIVYYMNGQVLNGRFLQKNFNSAPENVLRDINVIGTQYSKNKYRHWWLVGSLDEYYIFNRVLDATEIQCLANPSQCQLCDEYQYEDDQGNCQNCISPCKTCQSSTICDSCIPGYIKQGSSCIPCTFPCITCENTVNQCLSCNDDPNRNEASLGCTCKDNYQEGDNGYCVLIPCPTGEFRDSADLLCKPCLSPCENCSSSATQCTSCVPGYYFDVANKICVQCSYPCQNCNSPTNCTSCVDNINRQGTDTGCACDNLYQDNGTNCELIPCGEFEYRDTDNTCKPCQAPCKTCENLNYCKTCVDQYFWDSVQNDCNPCVYPCKTCSSAQQCQSCQNTQNRVNPQTGDCDCNTTYYDNGSVCAKIACHSDEVLGSDGFCERRRLDQDKYNLFIESKNQTLKSCISSNGFSNNEAQVACKSLNYQNLFGVFSDQKCKSCDYNSPFYSFSCNGSEKHWTQCQITQVSNQGVNDCVSITCERI